MIKTNLLILVLLICSVVGFGISLPVNTVDRNSINTIELTGIGGFGLWRKERPGVPAHFHTGIDIKRPSDNYVDEPVFPIMEGVVISIRRDGPFAQLIIEHESDQRFWTVYEHIAWIKVELYEIVKPDSPIARFMNRDELNRYGWQFDHFHFEVLKERPIELKRDSSKPERHFASYSLICFKEDDLNKYFYNPLVFLEEQFMY